MLRWWSRWRGRETSVEEQADAWMVRHGPYAFRLAGQRAIDAYLVGDLREQERWHAVCGEILRRVAPNAAFEDVTELLLAREGT